MLDKMKKFPIINIIVGSLLIIMGILFVFIIPDIGEVIKNVAIGVLILVLIGFLVYPELRKRRSRLLLSLLIVELLIGILVSVMFIMNRSGNPSLWIGLVIYVHGVVGLIDGYLSSKKQNVWLFFLSLLFVTIGVYIFASGLITNDMLLFVLLTMFLAPGLFLLVLGLLNLKTKKSKKQS
ncbi:MAG: hypothetical protein PHP78_04185 [Candidatus Izemoplasmatales bacterium]|nr:hypothetical protein [Candidatus Izemoplasmatales bacterium]